MTKEQCIEEIAKLIEHKERISPCEDDIHCDECFCGSKYIAEALYNAGYRKIDDEENEVLTDAVDATFRGAVLRLAEKLKQRSYCDNCFKDGKWHRYVFVEDIDDTAQKFLESET